MAKRKPSGPFCPSERDARKIDSFDLATAKNGETYGRADFALERQVNGLGRHSAYVAAFDEENFVAGEHACQGGRVARGRFADGDLAIGVGLREHRAYRPSRPGAAARP